MSALKIPGAPLSSGPSALGSVTPQQQVTLPPIRTADPGDARPSICLIGASGAGKTFQLGKLIDYFASKGQATLLVSIESKHQELARRRVKVMNISEAIEQAGTKRMPTDRERVMRLLAFRDQLRSGAFREHEGRPIGAIVFDGLMEVGTVMKSYKLSNAPTSATGGRDTRSAYGDLGNELIDFMAALKEAASDAGATLGIPPVAIVATCGETLRDGLFEPLLPGRMAIPNLPYQFEVMLRLAVETTEQGTQFVAHTVGGQQMYPQTGAWSAKAPAGILEHKIVNPDLGAIYEKLIEYYRGDVVSPPQGE